MYKDGVAVKQQLRAAQEREEELRDAEEVVGRGEGPLARADHGHGLGDGVEGLQVLEERLGGVGAAGVRVRDG